ncbi:hypothetical protein ACFYKX_25465 [Cytobacillus sp. FJAT-54145]|uniref:Uncharacterized protein n=1 Tax=Cytobacillus spartinae TaxID=3299023 RepID=A0ABW6KL16_9BACI
MFVNYKLEDIKRGKVNLNKEVPQEDVILIVQSFESECIDISNWHLIEIARTTTHRVYGFDSKDKELFYMHISSAGEVLPCYFKNHDVNGYSAFVASSINESIKLHEKSYEPKLLTL